MIAVTAWARDDIAPALPWTVTAGHDLSRIYTMPAGYDLNRLYYTPQTEDFALGVVTPQGAAQYYNIHGAAAAGTWSPQPPATQAALPLLPYGVVMNLGSRLIRGTAAQNFDQPFGDYKALLLVSENRYTKKASRSGRFGATIYEETLGRGKATFSLMDTENHAVFSVTENYAANSSHYVFVWTPDGRYVVMIAPKPTPQSPHAVLIAGPLPVTQAARVAGVNLRNPDIDRDAADHNALIARTITPSQRYGALYDLAIRRLMACRDLLNNIGRPDSITLDNPLNAIPFGEEQDPIGMHLRLGFVAGDRQGELELAAPFVRTGPGRKASLRDYFTIVTITTDKDKIDVFCPP